MEPAQRIFSAIGEVSQVCWERIHGRTLATSHLGNICLWDLRRLNLPTQTIMRAHHAPILAMDFSTLKAGGLVSSCHRNRVGKM